MNISNLFEIRRQLLILCQSRPKHIHMSFLKVNLHCGRWDTYLGLKKQGLF